jgi:undecaprenyl-diphosphatase
LQLFFGSLSNLDYKLFLSINSWAGHYAWLDALGYFFAVYGIFILIAAAIGLGFYKIHRERFYIALISSAVSSFFLVKILKILVNRQRPFEAWTVHQLVTTVAPGQSFASGHAVIMFSIAFSFFRTRYFWPFLVWASISSVARVFVGVHYPGDVLASIALAGVIVYFIRRLFKIRRLS